MSGSDRAEPPLRVDWIDATLLEDGLPGRLGLTFLPGKRGPSVRYPGVVYRRELAVDLATLRAKGVIGLLLLIEDPELERWGDPDFVARAREAGIAVERRPMPDGAAPASLDEAREIVRRLRAMRADGDVAVACMGGVGRTGTIAACALVDAGMDPDAAIAHVRGVRHPAAVETAAQEAFVREFAAKE